MQILKQETKNTSKTEHRNEGRKAEKESIDLLTDLHFWCFIWCLKQWIMERKRAGNVTARFVFKLCGLAIKLFNSCSSQLQNSTKPVVA